MKKFAYLLIGCFAFLHTNAQTLDAYKIFSSKGESVDFEKMVEKVRNSNVVLFGELHDNPISHWLQIELTKALYTITDGKILLGAEMFEADNQLILAEYIQGYISQSRFEADARLWTNYKTDYKPLVEFSKQHRVNFVATNIPRRYASMVAGGGFEALDALSAEAKKFIAPLPIPYNPELPGYKSMLEMGGMPGKSSNENFPKAQAIKDATMAWNIVQNYENGKIFVHFHGTYHSNNYEGIYWYLNQYKPGKTVSTIATVLQENTSQLDKENLGIADFIIVVPKTMTRTY
jgi:uncharacterized iron-regulated protein